MNALSRDVGCCFAVLFLMLVSMPASPEDRTRLLTPEQILKEGARATETLASVDGDNGLASSDQAETKTLANGLYFEGSFSYERTGDTVVLRLDRINNDSFSRTTGTLRLELWAATSQPPRGVGFSGYRLAVSNTLSPLPPRTYYSQVVRTTSFREPPPGTYWLVFVLTEFSSSCSGNDGYCVQDTGTFSTQRTFGPAQTSTVTALSRAGEQCYENYPRAAFDLVQQNAPGMFQAHSPSTSCASLGMPVYAGLLLGTTDVRVYTSNLAVAQFLCSTGLISSCTSPPPPSFTDLWWNPAEPGWGVTITHRPTGIAFVTWFTYDSFGNSKWYVASECRMSNSRCTGTLYETRGPAFGATFDSSLVSVRAVGSVTLAFSTQGLGLMSYTVNGVSGSKFIVRQVF